jgi:lysophospholipase L1-like esterase
MPRRDDSMLDRFEGDDVRHLRARDAILALALAGLLLIIFAGDSVRGAAERLPSGVGQKTVEAVGTPTGWIADQLPLTDVRQDLTAPLSPDRQLVGVGFEAPGVEAAPGSAAAEPGAAPITADSFDPGALGVAPEPIPLDSLLVTGDSMSQPLDSELARRLSADGVEVIREPYLGSGISDTDIVDWGKLSVTQAAEEPDAVVVFIGAGDGYAMPGADGELVDCCSPQWAAIYATRARQMMDAYRRAGAARVYWMTIPTPRNPERAAITRVVNEAIEVAAQPWRSQIEVIDLVELLTPGGGYRDAIEIGGTERIVRASDGLHLNEAGASLVADQVMNRLDVDFQR